MPFHWIVYDRAGEEIRQSDDFDSRAEAEEWMSSSWAELVEQGGASVRLASDDGPVYDMGLAGR